MLYSFKKHYSLYNMLLNFKHTHQKFLHTSRLCIIIKPAPFFRKMFFKTLLLYFNVLNCNFFYSADQNFFYFPAFMYISYSNNHPCFYSKFLSIK